VLPVVTAGGCRVDDSPLVIVGAARPDVFASSSIQTDIDCSFRSTSKPTSFLVAGLMDAYAGVYHVGLLVENRGTQPSAGFKNADDIIVESVEAHLTPIRTGDDVEAPELDARATNITLVIKPAEFSVIDFDLVNFKTDTEKEGVFKGIPKGKRAKYQAQIVIRGTTPARRAVTSNTFRFFLEVCYQCVVSERVQRDAAWTLSCPGVGATIKFGGDSFNFRESCCPKQDCGRYECETRRDTGGTTR